MTAQLLWAVGLAAGLAASPGGTGWALKERAVLKAHPAAVRCVAFGPGGKVLASGGQGEFDRRTGTQWGEVRLWDVTTRKQRALLKGHRADVIGLAFSGDGKAVASADSSGALLLWDPPSGKQRLALRGPQSYGQMDVAFSGDGKRLGAAAAVEAKVWEAATGKELSSFKRPWTRSVLAAFSPDLRLLASANHQDVDLFDVRTGKESNSLLDHRGSVSGLAFSGDGRTLAAVSHRTTAEGETIPEVKLWDVRTGRARATFRRGLPSVHAVAFRPGGKVLALAGRPGVDGPAELLLLEVPSGQVLARRSLPKGVLWVHALAFSPDGRLLAAGCGDGAVRVWEVVAPAAKR
jgi:WD40 repeat protein